MADIKIVDPVVENWFQWRLPKRKPTSTEIIHHTIAFLTGTPGYRIQLRAQIDRLHGDIYFSVRLLKGPFDHLLTWPCQQAFAVRLGSKTEPDPKYSWRVPKAGGWGDRVLTKPRGRRDNIFSDWHGPFEISGLLVRKHIGLEFVPCEWYVVYWVVCPTRHVHGLNFP